MKIRDYEMQDVSVISDPMLLTLIKVDSNLKDDTDYEMINIVNYQEGKPNIILEVQKQDTTFLMIMEDVDSNYRFKDANNKIRYESDKSTAVEGITEFLKNLE